MYKIVTYDTIDNTGIHAYKYDPYGMEKTATEFSSELKEFLESIKPETGKTFILVNALSAGEYFGPNRNGDYFPETVLEKYHKTFEALARPYKHHINKDPNKSYGRVLFAFYNKNMHRVELVIELDNFKAPDIVERIIHGDNVAVSMGCFISSTKIITCDFLKKNIEEIKIGDKVLTHTGKIRKVIELHHRDYEGQVYNIKPVGKYRNPIIATKEHPWLIIEPEKFYKSNYKNWKRPMRDMKNNITLQDAVWKTSEELTGEEFLVCPKPQIENEIQFDINKAKLLGWYLAEGHTHINDNGVEFSVNKEDQIVNEINEVCKSLNLPEPFFRKHSMSDKAQRIVIYSDNIKQDCLKYCGKYSHLKKLHPDIFNWQPETKLVFLGAMISGDGFFHKGQTYISSCNKELLEQLQWLAMSVGLNSTIGKNEHKAGNGFSNYDTVEWILRFRKTCNEQLSKYATKVENISTESSGGKGGPYEYNDFYLVKIETIDEQFYCGPVYNFEVEEDNSYVVENWAVHNCRVPHDVCSICGHQAKRVTDYCEHLRKPQMGKLLPDGQRAYAINTRPKFFDISFVSIPAEETAGVMLKVAGVATLPLSAEVGEQWLKQSGLKESQLTKEIEGKIISVSKDPRGLIYDSQPEIPKEDLIRVCKKYPLSEILSTFLGLRIMPKPQDFQRMVLYKSNKTGLADYCDNNKILFPTDMEPAGLDDVHYDKFNPVLAKEVQHLVPGRSLTKPLIIIRIMQKRASLEESIQPVRDYWQEVKKDEIRKNPAKNPFFALLATGGLYAAWRQVMGLGASISIGQLEQLLVKHPWLWPLLLSGTALAATQAQKLFIEKEAGILPELADVFTKISAPLVGRTLASILIGVPGTYTYAGYQEAKVRQGKPIGKINDLVRKHPFLTSLISTPLLYKGLGKTPFYKKASAGEILYNLNNDALDKLFEDVISV